MSACIIFDQIQKPSYKVEGALAYISAWPGNLLSIILIKACLLPTLGKLEQVLDLKALDRELAEKVYARIRKVCELYQETLPLLRELHFPFYNDRDRAKVIYYSEYLEDVVEALEIGLDTQAASKIELLAQTTASSPEIRPWREALGQI